MLASLLLVLLGCSVGFSMVANRPARVANMQGLKILERSRRRVDPSIDVSPIVLVPETEKPRKATCAVQPDPNSDQYVYGLITFTQESPSDELYVDVDLSGFHPINASECPTTPQGSKLHGFHVHQYGDLSDGCKSAGGHFNPTGATHGAPDSAVRHTGDFGNVEQNDDGTMMGGFTDSVASLYGGDCIIGRAIVIHAGEDDLGGGGDPGSLAHGNAGPRVACCTIGLAKPDNPAP